MRYRIFVNDPNSTTAVEVLGVYAQDSNHALLVAKSEHRALAILEDYLVALPVRTMQMAL